MNTPTPRTDEAEFNGRDMGNDSNPPHFKCVDADFARTLERERAEANRKLEAAKEALLYYENQTENSPAIHGGSYARKALTIINSTKGD